MLNCSVPWSGGPGALAPAAITVQASSHCLVLSIGISLRADEVEHSHGFFGEMVFYFLSRLFAFSLLDFAHLVHLYSPLFCGIFL